MTHIVTPITIIVGIPTARTITRGQYLSSADSTCSLSCSGKDPDVVVKTVLFDDLVCITYEALRLSKSSVVKFLNCEIDCPAVFVTLFILTVAFVVDCVSLGFKV